MEDFYLAIVEDPEIGSILYAVGTTDRGQAPKLIAQHYQEQGWPLAGPIEFKRVSLMKIAKYGCVEIARPKSGGAQFVGGSGE